MDYGFGVGVPATKPRFAALAPITLRRTTSLISSTPSPRSASALTMTSVSPGSSLLIRSADRPSSATFTWLLPLMTVHEGEPSSLAGLPVAVTGFNVTFTCCSFVIRISRGIFISFSFGFGCPTDQPNRTVRVFVSLHPNNRQSQFWKFVFFTTCSISAIDASTSITTLGIATLTLPARALLGNGGDLLLNPRVPRLDRLASCRECQHGLIALAVLSIATGRFAHITKQLRFFNLNIVTAAEWTWK